MKLRIIRGDRGEWIGQFPVGAYQCTMFTFDSKYEVMWRPAAPIKMSGLMTVQYRAGRDAFLGHLEKDRRKRRRIR
jgi:hypothetical protein